MSSGLVFGANNVSKVIGLAWCREVGELKALNQFDGRAPPRSWKNLSTSAASVRRLGLEPWLGSLVTSSLVGLVRAAAILRDIDESVPILFM